MKLQNIDRKTADKEILKDVSRILGEALTERASELCRWKVLAGLHMAIEAVISSKSPRLEEI